MALWWWKKLVTGFSLWNLVSVSVAVSAWKYRPIWVSVSVSDLNQNSGFGRTLVYSILLFFGDCTWDTSHTFFSRWSISQIRWKVYHCVRSQLLHLTNVVVCLLCFQKIHKNLQKTPPNYYYLPPQLSTLYNYHLRITKLVMTIELWQLKWLKYCTWRQTPLR